MTPPGQMVAYYWRGRLSQLLPPREAEAFRTYLSSLIYRRGSIPMRRSNLDWQAIAAASGVAPDVILSIAERIEPALRTFSRSLALLPALPSKRSDNPGAKSESSSLTSIGPCRRGRPPKQMSAAPEPPAEIIALPDPIIRRRGPRPMPISDHPEPILPDDRHPRNFGDALATQMRRFGETISMLVRAVALDGIKLEPTTLRTWIVGRSAPRTLKSRKIVKLIESRYRLPDNYLMSRLPLTNQAPRGHDLLGIPKSERRRLAWHLPDDFEERPSAEQEEIVSWVRENILTCTTPYRKFQAAASKQTFALRFIGAEESDFDNPDYATDLCQAPPALCEEMRQLVLFKSATLVTAGLNREGIWGAETASQRTEHLALMFGALAASPNGEIRGRGVPLKSLTLALLVFPSVWDWYLTWREQRRGFYTQWEGDMLSLGLSMARKETGWLRQHPGLADRLIPIEGLISQTDIDKVRQDWEAACDRFMKHGLTRKKEVERVKRVHRDPFETILPILEADSPLGEYRKITEAILLTIPDENRYPIAAAEAVRSFVTLRFGLHLGVRQKNLRQLLVKHRHELPSSDRQLEDLKRGELRWSVREKAWEVVIPANAFKNSTSTYFGGKNFRLLLPDLGRLYEFLEAYLDRHRAVLLRGARDPGTFFVKNATPRSKSAEYNQTAFYEMWRLTIQRYGIFNPFTGRGAIKGLMGHGPHAVRDVLATHVLKVTGSFEQAAFAIQDTAETVQTHYGRFLPEDKAALAARVLNQVWAA